MARKEYFTSLGFMTFSTVVTGILFGCLLLACDSRPKEEISAPQSTHAADLTTHPVYSKYQFGANEHTIDFGTQPLAIPTGTLAEGMRRDQVLSDLLAEAGFTLKTHPFYKGDDLNFFLKRGDLELAVAGDMPALSAVAGNYAVALALAKQNYSALVTEKIARLEDLKNRRVGYAPGSTAHYMLLEALETIALTDRDVTLVPLKVTEMYDALKAGTIDAFAAWEPTPTIALKQSGDLKILHRSLSSSYLYCSQSFLTLHPETVKLLVASITRSMKWLAISPNNIQLASDWSMEAVNAFSGKQSPLARKEYARLIDDGIVSIASSPIIPLNILKDGGLLHKEFLFMQQKNMIPAEITWAATRNKFDRSMMVEVLNNPVLFRLTEYHFTED